MDAPFVKLAISTFIWSDYGNEGWPVDFYVVD